MIMKKLSAVALILAVVVAAAGCNLMQLNPERDAAQVVAVVNGEQILKSDVDAMVGFSYDTNYTPAELETLQASRESALESLISDTLVLQRAESEGLYEFTEEELADIQNEYDVYVTNTYETSLEKYKELAKDDPEIDPEQKANEELEAYLAALGVDRDSLMEDLRDTKAAEKLFEMLSADATVTAEEISNAYTEQLLAQQESYAAAPAQVISDIMNDEVVIYRPAQVRYVKQILISFDSELTAEITELRNNGEGSAANAKLYEGLKSIQEEADEVLAKVVAGEDFDKLIEEYNDDPGMASYPNGYPTIDGYEGYYANFQNEAMALKNVGDTSAALIFTDYGYHILKLCKVEEAGIASLGAVEDALEEQLLNTAKYLLWNSKLSEMADAASISRYPNRLH